MKIAHSLEVMLNTCRKKQYNDFYQVEQEGVNNGRQNELRHFALNWAFLHFTEFKIHALLCRCSSYLQKTTNTPTLNGGDRGGVWIVSFSEVTLLEYNVSTILSPIVELNKVDHFFGNFSLNCFIIYTLTLKAITKIALLDFLHP